MISEHLPPYWHKFPAKNKTRGLLSIYAAQVLQKRNYVPRPYGPDYDYDDYEHLSAWLCWGFLCNED